MSDLLPVVVTGASRGLGRALALLLLERGHRVLGTARAAANLEHPRFVHGTLDLCDPSSVESFCAGALTDFAALAERGLVLVQNAGAIDPVGSLERWSQEDWTSALQLAVIGPARLAGTCLRLGQGPLHIVQVSSGAARRALPGWSAYCTGKAAFEMLGRCIAADAAAYPHLAHRPVRVVSFGPGVVDTDMQAAIRGTSPRDFPPLARFEELHQNGQLAAPAAVALRIADLIAAGGEGWSEASA